MVSDLDAAPNLFNGSQDAAFNVLCHILLLLLFEKVIFLFFEGGDDRFEDHARHRAGGNAENGERRSVIYNVGSPGEECGRRKLTRIVAQRADDRYPYQTEPFAGIFKKKIHRRRREQPAAKAHEPGGNAPGDEGEARLDEGEHGSPAEAEIARRKHDYDVCKPRLCPGREPRNGGEQALEPAERNCLSAKHGGKSRFID